jgi:hypothetical protein
MSAKEFNEWIAYLSLQDEEYKKKIELEVKKENNDAKDLANEMKAFFQGLGK